jgi:cytochrome c553
MLKTLGAAVATVAALSLAGTAVAQQAPGGAKGDPERAKNKISMCQGCHGIPLFRTAYPQVYRVPLIAGQTPAYLVKALEAYKSGERTHPSMRAIARSLSAEDMADVAAYYGREKQ